MIKPLAIFRTPDSWSELYQWIHSHSPEDRAHITTAVGMAWNLAAKESNKGEDK
jgi:hypothetical protein